MANKPQHCCPGVTRRSFLADTGMGFTGLALGALLFRDGVARADAAWSSTQVVANSASEGAKQGVKEAIAELLKQVDRDSNSELTKRYPDGYILLGLADGKIVYLPRLQRISVEGVQAAG